MPKQTFHNLPENKHTRVIDAAIEEITAHGADSANIQSITTKSGISRGSFYQYFAGKEDMYVEVLKIILKRRFEYLSPVQERWEQVSIFETLNLLLKLGVEFGRKYPQYAKATEGLRVSKRYNTPRLAKQLELTMLTRAEGEEDMGTYKFYEKVVKRAAERGEIATQTSRENIALYIQSTIDQTSKIIINKPSTVDEKEIESICERFFCLLKNGIQSK